MVNKPIRSKGYSKKELLEIIDKIDSNKDRVQHETAASNPRKENTRSPFPLKYSENR